MVRNNSLVSISLVLRRVSASNFTQHPLVCQGITGGQWYEPSGVLFPLAMPDMVNVTLPRGGLGQQNVSRSSAVSCNSSCLLIWCSMCCTNTTITRCVGMYTDLINAAAVNLATASDRSTNIYLQQHPDCDWESIWDVHMHCHHYLLTSVWRVYSQSKVHYLISHCTR